MYISDIYIFLCTIDIYLIYIYIIYNDKLNSENNNKII